MKSFAAFFLISLLLPSCGSSSGENPGDISSLTGTFQLGSTDSGSLKLDPTVELTLKKDKSYTLTTNGKTYDSYFNIGRVKQAFPGDNKNTDPIQEKEGIMEIYSISFSKVADDLPEPLGKSFSDNAAPYQYLFHYVNGHHDLVGYDCSIIRYSRSFATNEGEKIEQGLAFYRIG